MTAADIAPAALTVKQASAYLGVSVRTLYTITAQAGAGSSPLPYVQIRGRRLFRRADLDAYLAANTVSASA